MCGLLIGSGLAGSVDEAKRRVSRVRPGVSLTPRQLAAVERWFAQYGGKAAREHSE